MSKPSPKITRLAAALIAEVMRQAETSGITRFELQKTSVSLCAAKELAAQGHRWVCKGGKIFINLNQNKFIMKIEMQIPKLGKAKGTVGWVVEQLSGKELYIAKDRYGVTGLYIRFSEKSSRWVCEPQVVGLESQFYQRSVKTESGYDACAAKPTTAGSYHGECGIFDCPLTPAAYDYADEFIRKAAEGFMEQWENDKAE